MFNKMNEERELFRRKSEGQRENHSFLMDISPIMEKTMSLRRSSSHCSKDSIYRILRDVVKELQGFREDTRSQLNLIEVNTKHSSHSGKPALVDPVRENKAILFVRVSVLNVGDIDTIKQQFECDFFMSVKWKEPRFRGKRSREDVDWDCQWDPYLYFLNAVSHVHYERKHDLEDVDNKYGPTVCMYYRIKGIFREFLDVKDFPFDYQNLNLILSSDRPVDAIDFHGDPYMEDTVRTWTFASKQEWELQPYILSEASATHTEVRENLNERIYPLYNITLYATRKSTFYVFNIALVMGLISLLAFTSFTLSPSESGNRLQITLILLLTAVAFKFGVSQYLPTVCYQTLMDKYVLGCMVFLFVMSVQNGIVGAIGKNTSVQTMFDIVCFCIAFAGFVVFHLVFACIALRKTKEVELLKVDHKKRYLEKSQQRENTESLNGSVILDERAVFL